MNQLCAWILCLGVLVSLGLAIAILMKQKNCCKGEGYSFEGCYPCPNCGQAKKMLMSKLCQSSECRRYPNSPNCIPCKQSIEALNCQCCDPRKK